MSDILVEISKNASEILALAQAAEKLEEEMEGIKQQTKALDQQYDELLVMRNALHEGMKRLYNNR